MAANEARAAPSSPALHGGQQLSGMLNPHGGAAKFRLTRYPPSDELSCFVQRYWVATWDLRGQPPYRQETIPHPCVNLILRDGASRVYGVISARYTTLLEGQGRVFGVKFRPGGFYPFLRAPVSRLTDSSVGLGDIFAADGDVLAATVLAQPEDELMVEQTERFLRQRLPPADANVALIGRIVERVVAERAIVMVDDITGRFGLGKRTVQRLFSKYVGVSPKWVIRNCRLQEAADYLAAIGPEGAVRWPQLALDLGYFDQSHFINDFKAVIGTTPAEYLRGL